MKIGFLITARLKSSRLKLKLLKPLNGRNVIERVIDRAKIVTECDEVILCTSSSNQDLPLVRAAVKNNIFYYNGSPEDVLQRLLEAAELFSLDYFIGVTADNPLFSVYHANLLSDMIRTDESNIDFIYTTGMPIGVNMYAINTKALRTVCEYKNEIDTEIWGYLINRPDIFNVVELPVAEEYKYDLVGRITLDYIEDYRFMREVFQFFPQDTVVDILDVYDFISTHPEVIELNSCVKQLDLADDVKHRIERFFEENYSKIVEIKERIYRN